MSRKLKSHSNKAAGLRRLLSVGLDGLGVKSRYVTFLSALSQNEKNATIVNLAAGLVRLGNDVLLLDMHNHETEAAGVVNWLKVDIGLTLVDVANHNQPLQHATHVTAQGFKIVRFGQNQSTMSEIDSTKSMASELNELIDQLGNHVDMVLVDGELDNTNPLMTEILARGEIIILVTKHPESIKSAYSLIKRAHCQFGRRNYGVLVTNVDEGQAERLYNTIADVAGNFLSVPLTYMGYVPQDDYLRRASLSGVTVLDAFPKAGASIAFSRVAQQMLDVNKELV